MHQIYVHKNDFIFHCIIIQLPRHRISALRASLAVNFQVKQSLDILDVLLQIP